MCIIGAWSVSLALKGWLEWACSVKVGFKPLPNLMSLVRTNLGHWHYRTSIQPSWRSDPLQNLNTFRELNNHVMRKKNWRQDASTQKHLTWSCLCNMLILTGKERCESGCRSVKISRNRIQSSGDAFALHLFVCVFEGNILWCESTKKMTERHHWCQGAAQCFCFSWYTG